MDGLPWRRGGNEWMTNLARKKEGKKEFITLVIFTTYYNIMRKYLNF